MIFSHTKRSCKFFYCVAPFYLIFNFITAIGLGIYAGIGITAGAHRLWAHKAYKAKWPLRLILMIANLVAFEDAIWFWVRDHR